MRSLTDIIHDIEDESPEHSDEAIAEHALGFLRVGPSAAKP